MDFWKDSPYRLRIATNIFGPRIQFVIAAAMLATVVAQTGFIAIWSYPLLAPLALWIVIILSRRSVWVVMDRAYQRVTIESRRILGFVTFKRAIRELQELRAVPVTTRYRGESFGGETTWTFHLMFGDDRAVPIGSVVNDARKVESALDQIRGVVGERVTAARYDPEKVRGPSRNIVLEILDNDPIARTGQILCLLMIALSLYAAPTMALFYIGLLVFGTLADWMSRRNED